MSDVRDTCMEDYLYDLPDERIAKYPLSKRDESKLLLYRGGDISTKVFKELPTVLPAGTLLVFNNTKVIQARLHFRKESGGLIEVFCLDPVEPSDYQLAFSATSRCVWRCMIGRLKLWKSGALQKQCIIDGKRVTLCAVKLSSAGMVHNVEFTWDGGVSFAEILDSLGELPIPPYLNRESEESDKRTYQTVYSKIKGSVAAPTAGLHFTEQVLNDLDANGIGRTELTLHVGAGTFYPVKSDSIGGHDMHTEVIEVPLATLKRIRASVGNIIAVGTTSVRTLESLYFMGCRLLRGNCEMFVSQWEPYSSDIATVKTEDALDALIEHLEKNGLDYLHGSTQIIIVPGYKLHVVRGLVTNFHQPKSTLLLLIAAFIGDDWRRVYEYAMRNGYRFLSYGDSSLLFSNK